MKPFQLFFSNRSKDQPDVDSLKATLADLLPNLPFEDVSQGVPFNDDWKTPAKEILQSCDALICAVGPDTHKSEPVDWEIREATRHGKPLLVTRKSEEHKLPSCCEELQVPVVPWNTIGLAARIGELLVHKVLFRNHDWESGETPDTDQVWNQYQLMVQSSEALVSRRQEVSTRYLTALGVLLSAIGALVALSEKAGITNTLIGITIFLALGAVLSWLWKGTINSLGVLNKAKFKVISALEDYLPAQLFDAEWKVLESNRYKSTTESDKSMAFGFFVFFLVVSLGTGIAAGYLIFRC